MKVLFLIDTLSIGGAEKSLLEITSRLRETEPIVCTSYGREHLLASRFREAGLPVRHLGLNGKYAFREGCRRLADLLEKEQPDLVVATLFRSEMLARFTCPKKNVPLIGSFVSESYSSERIKRLSFALKLKFKLVELLDKFTAKKAQAYYSITKTIAEANRKKLGLTDVQVKVIYRGRCTYDYYDKEKSFGAPFIFLISSRLLWQKGFKSFIDAIQKLKKTYKIEAWVAGDGRDKDQIQAYVRRVEADDRIKFLGWQDDIPAVLEKAHAFVLPSHYEGLGGSVIEAMLANRPVILSDIPVFREVAADHAYYVRMGDAGDLAAKMACVMDHYEQAQAKAARALDFARERYDIEKIARQHEAFYREVVEQYQSRRRRK